MDINAIVITLVSGFVAVAILLTIAFSISIIIRASRGGGRKRSGNTARYQRMLAQAVKRARYMGLMPYVGS